MVGHAVAPRYGQAVAFAVRERGVARMCILRAARRNRCTAIRRVTIGRGSVAAPATWRVAFTHARAVCESYITMITQVNGHTRVVVIDYSI